MTIRTPLCDMLGIKYPIMLAGMGGVSYGELAAAVSEAGGFGTLGMAGRSLDEIKREMKIVRDKTDKPFGVDLLAAVPEFWSAPSTSSSKAAPRRSFPVSAYRRRT